MHCKPTLSQVQRATRAQVCARCPYRTAGTDHLGADNARTCEADCELFRHLPVLREAAQLVDPLLTNRPRMLHRILDRMCQSRGKRHVAMQRNNDRVLDLFEDFYG